VLEVGANNNRTGFKQYFIDTGAEYTGTDLTDGPDVDVACDLTKDSNPLPKNYFDLVVCCSVMEHVPNPWDMARCIGNLVKPGGKLYISVPWVWRYHPYPDDYYRFSFSAIRYLYPDFAWGNYAYSTEMENDIRWVTAESSNLDNKWAIRNETNKKYLPYLMIDMLGTKNVS
jgi:SAM-dependent methyltransferase